MVIFFLSKSVGAIVVRRKEVSEFRSAGWRVVNVMLQVVRGPTAVRRDHIVLGTHDQASRRVYLTNVGISLDLCPGVVHGSANEELIRQDTKTIRGCIGPILDVNQVLINRHQAGPVCEGLFSGVGRIGMKPNASSSRPSHGRLQKLAAGMP